MVVLIWELGMRVESTPLDYKNNVVGVTFL